MLLSRLVYRKSPLEFLFFISFLPERPPPFRKNHRVSGVFRVPQGATVPDFIVSFIVFPRFSLFFRGPHVPDLTPLQDRPSFPLRSTGFCSIQGPPLLQCPQPRKLKRRNLHATLTPQIPRFSPLEDPPLHALLFTQQGLPNGLQRASKL